jgi:hypothetical protein
MWGEFVNRLLCGFAKDECEGRGENQVVILFCGFWGGGDTVIT